MVKPISLPFMSAFRGKNIEAQAKDFTASDAKIGSSSSRSHVGSIIKSELHFISVEDLIEADELIQTAKQGHQVFINLRPLISATDKYFKFIHKLKQEAIPQQLQLYQISQELLLLVEKGQEIQVRTLKKMAQPESQDELLPASMAGY